MNFLGRLITEAVFEKVAEKAIVDTAEHIENNHSVSSVVNKSTADYMLFLREKSKSANSTFIVRDEFDKSKYVIKTDLKGFEFPRICLYNMNENKIGKVELTDKIHRKVCSLYLDEKMLGKITRKKAVKIDMSVSINDWRLKGKSLWNGVVVTDANDSQIMKFTKVLSSEDVYVLELKSQKYEIFGLLLIMAVEIMIYG